MQPRHVLTSPFHAVYRLALPLLMLVAAAACSSATPAPAKAPATLPAVAGGSCALENAGDDQSAIRGVLNAEGQMVVSQNIDSLMALWSEDSRIVDAKNTPDDSGDDQVWEGKDAIRHRYVRIVFPGAPTAIDHSDEEIAIDGDKAKIESTTSIGSEVAKSGDRWEMIRQGSCWYLAGLTYNLEPAP